MASRHSGLVKQLIMCCPILTQRLFDEKKELKGTCDHYCTVCMVAGTAEVTTEELVSFLFFLTCHMAAIQAGTDFPPPTATTCSHLSLNQPKPSPPTGARLPAAHVPGARLKTTYLTPNLGRREHSPRTCTFMVAGASTVQASQFRDSPRVSTQENISTLSTPRATRGFPCPDLASKPQTPASTPALGLSPRVGSHWRPSD